MASAGTDPTWARRARSAVSLALFAAAAFAARTASAQEDELRLAWSAPPGCPTGEEVKAAAMRGVDRGKMASGTLVADARVEQVGPSSWRVELATRRGDNAGERAIEGPTCAGVADATAVILALALVPPTTIEAPPPPPPQQPDRVVAPAPAPTPRHHFAAGVAFAGNLGALPKTGAGGEVELAWTPGRLRIEGEGRWLVSQTEHVSGKAAAAEFSLEGIGARGCYAVIARSSFDVAPCLGAGLEIMTAEGKNTAEDRSPTKVWASVAGGALGRIFVAKWLALRARAEAVVPLWRPDFVVQGSGSVFHPPTIGAAGYFGAEVLFL